MVGGHCVKSLSTRIDLSGAPECDKKRAQGTRTPYRQTIDTWSFGCVLSAVATWVVLGSQAYENYGKIRGFAISKLSERQKNGEKIRVPACNDAFHNGFEVLPEVLAWHNHLRNSAKRADTITRRVLNLVDEKMLVSNPTERVTSSMLCTELDEILHLAEREHKTAIDDGTLRKETPEILEALLKLDELAPVNASTLSANVSEKDSQLLPASNSDRKGKRLDNIVRAKTANRVDAIKKYLSTSLTDTELCESPTNLLAAVQMNSTFPAQDTMGLVRPRIMVSPSTESNHKSGLDCLSIPISPSDANVLQNHAANTPPRNREETHSESRRSRSISTSSLSPSAAHGGMPSVHGTDDRTTGAALIPPRSYENITELPGHLRNQDEAVGSGAQTTSAAELQSHRPARHPSLDDYHSRLTTLSNLRARDNSSHPVSSGPQPWLNPSTTAIYQEYHRLTRIWDEKSGPWAAILRRPPPMDEQLARFISNGDRDIVRTTGAFRPPGYRTSHACADNLFTLQKFVVDNAPSMRSHWDHVKITLLALAMKIGPLDDDGLDLVYTIGTTRSRLSGVKGFEIRDKFRQSLEKAGRNMEEQHEYHTNMAETLRSLFDAYIDTKKKQTLIVLTDGLWLGSKSKVDVEDAIKRFLTTRIKPLGKMETRWFTIQFISFGQDREALDRLKRLDDDLFPK